MSLKFKDEINFASFNKFKENDRNVVYELSCLKSNIKNKKFMFWIFFLSFLEKHEERKAHNMFSLTFDPRFKTLHLVSSLIDHEQSKTIVAKYDKRNCILCF